MSIQNETCNKRIRGNACGGNLEGLEEAREPSDPSEVEKRGGWVESSQRDSHPRSFWQGQWGVLEPVTHQRSLTSPGRPLGILP